LSHVQHYDAAGNKTPSVSEIPGIFAKDMDGFEDWICLKLHGRNTSHCCTKAKRDFYKESANLGHDIHNLREAFLKGQSFSDGVPEYQASVFDPIAKFYTDSGYKPLFIEEKMTGKTFGGTLDGAGTFSVPFWESQRATFWDKQTREYLNKSQPGCNADSVWIEDLKIKSKLDVLHPLQLYGYALLLKETKGIDAKWGLIVRREKNLDKRPEIQLRGYYLPAYKEQWDASMLMWKFLND
jgi:hypothetical protein